MDDLQKAKQRFSIIGNSPALIAAIDRAVKVAPIDLSVLVSGESGAGKEFFPQIIHAFGSRKHKKYIAVNCGAIPEGTIDSELFGHEKGSFTGAISARKGYFEEADGGTIFLDEVAELPLTTQARLLRVLESGEFLKVGSSEVQKTDIRVVAATNVDLLKAVRQGKFREDLYYRLSTVVINVPPLHDRGDDIILLARKFAADFAEKYRTDPISFSDDARRAMLVYNWPGNVRQLKNIVEQLALFNAGSEISRHDIIDILPLSHSGESSIITRNPENSYESERELLWKLIAALRRDIDDLRSRLAEASPSPSFTPLLPALADDAPSSPLLLSSPQSPASASPGVPSGIDCSPNREDGAPTPSISSPSGLDCGANAVSTKAPQSSGSVSCPMGHGLPPSLEEAEKSAITQALRLNNGDKKKTAQQLNISTRTLYRKINEYNISYSE